MEIPVKHNFCFFLSTSARIWEDASYELSVGWWHRRDRIGEDPAASLHSLWSRPFQSDGQRDAPLPRLLRQFEARTESPHRTTWQGTCREKNTGMPRINVLFNATYVIQTFNLFGASVCGMEAEIRCVIVCVGPFAFDQSSSLSL